MKDLATTKTSFISSIAKSMVGVRPRDIGIISVSFTSSSSERSMVKAMESNRLIDLVSIGTGTVTWNVSVALDRLGAISGATAYASLSSQIDTAMQSGTFIKLLTSSSPSLSSINSATTKINTYVIKTVISPTSAPSAAPTISVIIPTVSKIDLANYTRTTLTFIVNLISSLQFDVFGGSLYCIGLIEGSAPSSIGGIKAAASDGSSSKGASTIISVGAQYPLNLEVKFTGLSSLQSYSVFCYVETSVGTGSSMSTVLSTEVVASTICCKTIAFSNSPAFVYGDIMKYVDSNPTLFIFKYELSDAPSDVIEVTPLLLIDGIQSNDVVAKPLSVTLTRTSLLQGTFYLSAGSTISGTYKISFTVTGSSAAQYASDSVEVQVLSSSSPTPAPVMISSQFSNSGQAVLITFDSETDSGGINDVIWPCSSLFSFSSATGTFCTWTNTTTVSVSFGVISNFAADTILITVGSEVTLLKGLLRPFCKGDAITCSLNPTSTLQTVITQAPQIPSAPVVILNAPLFLGSCANLSLDATASYGNGGRPYRSIAWNVSATDYTIMGPGVSVDASSVIAHLKKSSLLYGIDRPINILGQSLRRASYTFTLTLINFFGLSTTQTHVVVVTSNPNIPILSIVGPSYQTIVASSPLTILSAATLSSCATKATSLVYSWAVQLGSQTSSLAISSVSFDPSRFSLPPYSLAVDKTYTITITAKAGISSSSAYVDVYVAHGVITAAVVGGYVRSNPIDKIFVLDASISTDADTHSSAKSTLIYQVVSTLKSLLLIKMSRN